MSESKSKLKESLIIKLLRTPFTLSKRISTAFRLLIFSTIFSLVKPNSFKIQITAKALVNVASSLWFAGKLNFSEKY